MNLKIEEILNLFFCEIYFCWWNLSLMKSSFSGHIYRPRFRVITLEWSWKRILENEIILKTIEISCQKIFMSRKRSIPFASKKRYFSNFFLYWVFHQLGESWHSIGLAFKRMEVSSQKSSLLYLSPLLSFRVIFVSH